MTSINEQLEREVYELLGNDVTSNPLCSIHALEAACQILDHKFDSLKTAIKRNDSKARETIFEDYSDSFRF